MTSKITNIESNYKDLNHRVGHMTIPDLKVASIKNPDDHEWDWRGEYTQHGTTHTMCFEKMQIDKKGKFKAKGHDDAGEFKFKGKIKKDKFTAKKEYAKHKIFYDGTTSTNESGVIYKVEGAWGHKKDKE